jgi:hypothetical protein
MPSRTELQGCSWANLLFFYKQMVQKGQGGIAVLNSILAFQEIPYSSTYSKTKDLGASLRATPGFSQQS